MKTTTVLLLALGVAGAGSSHAMTKGGVAGTCTDPIGQTNFCGIAWTQVNFVESTFWNEVHVRGIFSGPAYNIDNDDDNFLVWFLPSTWYVEVSYTTCAYAGPHSTSGYHWLVKDVEGVPIPTLPDETFDIFVLQACDCEGEPF